MSKYNVDLMLEVLHKIESDPESHNQRSWGAETSCGTTYCIAGWTCVLANKGLVWDTREGYTYLDHVVAPETYMGVRDVDIEAEKLLGLSPDEASDLFYTLNNEKSLNMLRDFIEKGKNQ